MTPDERIAAYKAEYLRTVGRPCQTITYRNGWYYVSTGGAWGLTTPYRAKQLDDMTFRLRGRPSTRLTNGGQDNG